MRGVRGIVRLAGGLAAATAGAAAYVLACGPFLTSMRPVESVRPARVEPYDRGQLGVVHEHFARRFLVQAYRRFSGRPAIAVVPVPAAVTPFVPDRDRGPLKEWRELHQRITGVDPKIETERRIGQYQLITNCLDGAFASAAATGRARAAKYGEQSHEAREWVRAQDAVLANCAGDGLVLPEPAPANADALTRADRAYQTAAAHFYAMEFDESARRFKQIAADTTSPWRPYGRYLAGRSLLRDATIPETLDRQEMLAAQAEFRATVTDRDAAFLHESAKGLLKLIAFRIDRTPLLHDFASTIGGADTVTEVQLDEYERLMDVVLGDTVSYDYSGIPDRDAVAASGDLNDWITVMQGTGDAAAARAVAQWKRTSSPAWLVASLWKIPAASADAPALLEAAGRVAPASPAYLTVAFLRVRLLASRGEGDKGRALLATLPRQPRDASELEAVNLLEAERFMLAQSLADLLQAAPRRIASERMDADSWRDTIADPAPDAAGAKRELVFDDDAGIVFSRRLPLTDLVAAAKSSALPARLRLRVASAAFTRAWLLGRDEEALAVAPVLRTLSPPVAADVQAFEAAAPGDRHIAGLRLLLRTPGMHANVTGVEDDEEYGRDGLSRDFEHTFRRNWWCAFSEPDRDGAVSESELLTLLYRAKTVPSPSFLSADERAAVDRERAVLAKLGTAPNYLADEAVKWATARPQDLDAAEALAHAVEGTRWGCSNTTTTTASRTAFQTLHRLFPKSEWARKTKYWY